MYIINEHLKILFVILLIIIIKYEKFITISYNIQNITLAYKPTLTLKTYFTQLKSKTTKNKLILLFMQFPAKALCNNSYIRLTIKYLEKCLNGHKYNNE